MNDKVKTELNNIVNALVATGIVSQIILFGSYARGEETPDSDLDICVLTTEKNKRAIDVAIELRLKVLDIRTMPLDLLAYEKDTFYFHAKRTTSFEHEIAQKGVTVYG